jgi:hypothetical protein
MKWVCSRLLSALFIFDVCVSSGTHEWIQRYLALNPVPDVLETNSRASER